MSAPIVSEDPLHLVCESRLISSSCSCSCGQQRYNGGRWRIYAAPALRGLITARSRAPGPPLLLCTACSYATLIQMLTCDMHTHTQIATYDPAEQDETPLQKQLSRTISREDEGTSSSKSPNVSFFPFLSAWVFFLPHHHGLRCISGGAKKRPLPQLGRHPC